MHLQTKNGIAVVDYTPDERTIHLHFYETHNIDDIKDDERLALIDLLTEKKEENEHWQLLTSEEKEELELIINQVRRETIQELAEDDDTSEGFCWTISHIVPLVIEHLKKGGSSTDIEEISFMLESLKDLINYVDTMNGRIPELPDNKKKSEDESKKEGEYVATVEELPVQANPESTEEVSAPQLTVSPSPQRDDSVGDDGDQSSSSSPPASPSRGNSCSNKRQRVERDADEAVDCSAVEA